MSTSRRVYHIIFFAVIALFFYPSCKKSIESRPSWEAEMLTPLLQTTLSLDDLLADSLVQVNSDQSLSLVFSNNLYSASIKDLTLEIPDTTINVNFSLQTLTLADQTIIYPYSLGAICQQLPGLGDLIIAFNGQTFPILPLNDIAVPATEIDATQFFQAAEIDSGFIDITLENGLPIDITNLVFEVKNKVDQQVLTQDTFLNLLTLTSQTKTVDLSGKHVEGTLLISVYDMDSPGGTVLIDTSDAIIITLEAHDITASSATAVFPSQNLIDEDKLTTYNLSGGAQLTQIRIKSGSLAINLSSTIPQESHFEYSLPSAKDASGNFISISQDLPPATSGNPSEFSQSFVLDGYSFDLTGPNGDLYNTFYSHLVASIDSTGQIVTLSKDDSISVSYELIDIVPDYITGYVGQQIVNVGPEETGFDFFSGIRGGTLSLENVDVNLTIENGIGVPGRLNLYDLISINSFTGKEVALTWNELGKPLSIPPATDNPFTPSVTAFALDNSNSNITSLVSNLPDKLSYTFDVFINPFGNSSNYQDFAYDTSLLEANLDIEVPMSLAASDLVLVDTIDFSIGNPEASDPQIKSGTFNLIAYNGFPLSTKLQMYFCNEDFQITDSLLAQSSLVAAGELNDQCLVSEKTKTVLTTTVDEAKMLRMQAATKAIIISTFNTASHPNCSFVKIYDNYTIDVQLTGLFTFFTGY